MLPLPEEMMRQWDEAKNLGIDPDQISLGSTRRIWWTCEKGHSWSVSPNSRTKKTPSGGRGIKGCPVCAGVKVQAGFNDLATTHPELARQWHPIRNGNVNPETVNAGSAKKVFWLCPSCGYEWQTKVNRRALNGTGCPACHGAIVLPGVNTLDTIPALASRWHPDRNGALTLQNTHLGSTKKVWWSCSCGRAWETSVQDAIRSYRHSRVRVFRCSDCNRGNHATSPHRALSEEAPEIAAEWHPTRNGPWQPSDFTARSEYKAWWQCRTYQHVWQAMIKNRVQGTGCPYCAGRKVLTGFNDLATIYPRIAEQWHPTLNGDLTPYQVSARSSKKVHWLCENGHVSEGSPRSKNPQGIDGPIGCLECALQRRNKP